MAESRGLMKLKLFIEKSHGVERVILAEADKRFVDFLFRLIRFPFCSLTTFLQENNDVYEDEGSFTNFHSSLKELHQRPNQVQRDDMTQISSLCKRYSSLSLSDSRNEEELKKEFFGCRNCYFFVTDDVGVSCPDCGSDMNLDLDYVPSTNGHDQGLLKRVNKFMVMDDLKVKPLSTVSVLALLKECGIKDVGVLEEKEVTVGIDEVVKMLCLSFMSKNVLSVVFLMGTFFPKKIDVDTSEFHFI